MALHGSGILSVLREALPTGRDEDGRRFFHSAVLLAAGSGSRFSGEIKKQFVEIGGVPALLRTARVFAACPRVGEIVVVAPQSDVDGCRNLLREVEKVTKVIAGGKTRQQSAKRGFDAINPKADFVAIHDAARCLVTEKMLNDTFDAAYRYGAAAAAEKAVDTVKRADVNGMVRETLNREEIWLAKTPQVFQAEVYRAACYLAERDGFSGTDDLSLAERLGFPVKLVPCGEENPKLTYPSDVPRMEAILAFRGQSAENGGSAE